MAPADETTPPAAGPRLSPPTRRALRGAVLRLVRAQRELDDAIASAHGNGADMPSIGREVGMDAFAVRDALVRAGALGALAPKERTSR